MNKRFVSIVLPVYNQAQYIGAIVDEYEHALCEVPFDHELILAVNGCHDNSYQVCQSLKEKHIAVRAFYNEKASWGLAVKTGLKEAKGDLLCYANSARTSAKDLILLLLYAAANPNVVIKANRKIRDGWIRRLGSLLYNIECRALFNLSYWDINGTPKVFPRTFDRLLKLSREDDLIDLEFNWICKTQNYPVLEVPIFSSRRHPGRSTTGFRSAIAMYLGSFFMWRYLQDLPRQQVQ